MSLPGFIMRTVGRLSPLVLLLALAACAKNSGRNSVWLVVKNETGRHIRDFALDYKTGAFKYELFSSGLTFGDYARVSGVHPLTISYTDDAGVRQAPDVGAELKPELIGGRVILTLRADGSVGREIEGRTGPPPGALQAVEDYMPWILGVLALLALPPLVLFLRKAKEGAAAAKAGLKKAFSNPVLDGAAAALGLVRKICPVRMFTLDPARPESWHEGTLDGRMLGLLDHGRLWVGGPDEATLCAFGRESAQAPFAGRDFTEREDNPLLRDEEIARLLAGFSSAVRSVEALADAVEASFDWKSATVAGVVRDAKLLSDLRTKIESFDPPLVRAVMRGDEAAVRELVKGGADLEAVTLGYLNAVTAAASSGKTEILRALLAAGAKPQPEYGRPLQEAARAGHLEAVRLLLDAGLPVNHQDGAGDTALIEAAIGGRADVVSFLLSRGADMNARNKDGGSALGYAQSQGHARVVELLKAAGAT